MIFVSAGHHNADPGAVGNGYREADLTKRLRNIIVANLKARGLQEGKDFIQDDDRETLSEYLKRIQTGDGSVVFEVHFDAGPPTANGCTMIIPNRSWTKEYVIEQQFGFELAKLTSSILGVKNRGVKDETQSHVGKLALMREHGINGLLEVGFITNKSDLDRYLLNEHPLGAAIANILIKYDGLK